MTDWGECDEGWSERIRGSVKKSRPGPNMSQWVPAGVNLSQKIPRSVRIEAKKRYFLVFLLSVEPILMVDPNELWFLTFYIFILLVFFLSVKSTLGKMEK